MSSLPKQEWLSACCVELARRWQELAEADGSPNRLAMPIALRLWSEHPNERPADVAGLWRPPKVRQMHRA
jgi:hypothetical protein